jgi:hypothetical protein
MSSTDMAVEEVWGVTLTRYLSAMGMVLVHYDCLLTIDDEVRRIFSFLSVSLSPHPPDPLFADAPCLAWGTFLAKTPLLH